MDDVQIENDRLTSQNKLLKDEIAVLRAELELASQTINKNDLSKEYDEAMKALSNDMREARRLNVAVSTKLLSVHETLKHERFHVTTLRADVETGLSDLRTAIQSAMTMVLLKYHDMIGRKDRERVAAVEKKESDLRTQKAKVAELEASQEEERALMQKRMETITRKVQALEVSHAEEMERLRRDFSGVVDDRRSLNGRIANLEGELAAAAARAEQAAAAAAAAEGRAGAAALRAAEVDAQLAAAVQGRAAEAERAAAAAADSAAATARASDLQAQLEKARQQFASVCATNEALQADMAALLQREASLRKEAGMTSLDKNEMQQRLNSITDKVRRIEADHAAETAALHESLAAAGRDRDHAVAQRHTIAAMNAELSKRIDELEATAAARLAAAAAADGAAQAAQAAAAADIATLRKNVGELESSVRALREDRDAAMDRAALLENARRDHERAAVVERHALQEKMDKLAAQAAQGGRSLALAQQTAADRETEVFRLKETIRRECEERVEKLQEIAMLKEKLVRFAEMHGTGGTGARSSGQDWRAGPPGPMDAAPGAGLQPLPHQVMRSGSLSMDLGTGAGSSGQGLGDSDDASWSHHMMRKAKAKSRR